MRLGKGGENATSWMRSIRAIELRVPPYHAGSRLCKRELWHGVMTFLTLSQVKNPDNIAPSLSHPLFTLRGMNTTAA